MDFSKKTFSKTNFESSNRAGFLVIIYLMHNIENIFRREIPNSRNMAPPNEQETKIFFLYKTFHEKKRDVKAEVKEEHNSERN